MFKPNNRTKICGLSEIELSKKGNSRRSRSPSNMPATDDKDVLFAVSCAMTALMLFILGALKSRFTAYTWYRSGLEVLGVGGSCAAAAYLIGWGIEVLLASVGVHVEGTECHTNLTAL